MHLDPDGATTHVVPPLVCRVAMAAVLDTKLANDGVCDVFLSHAGEQKKYIVDCMYQLLVREGGRGRQRSHRLNVFLDQHSLELGGTAWAVMEEKAATCRIGMHFGYPRSTVSACATADHSSERVSFV
jgi:hypothetical protein